MCVCPRGHTHTHAQIHTDTPLMVNSDTRLLKVKLVLQNLIRILKIF